MDIKICLSYQVMEVLFSPLVSGSPRRAADVGRVWRGSSSRFLQKKLLQLQQTVLDLVLVHRSQSSRMRSAFLIPCLLVGIISCSSPPGAVSLTPKVVPLLIDLTPYYRKDLSPVNPVASPRLLRSAEGEEAGGRAAPSSPSSGGRRSGSDLNSNQQPVLTSVNSWTRGRAARSHTRYKQRRVLFRRFHYSPAAL
ncbi:hypothetical protein FQA47_011074 [Oryzias melastigma]|uniref:Uncharacterized protein n=1 Tax=Oryzias melastigma TaxID=30732 RepID=A0A834C159_ORYME|nr:hypothetical protein FQA47_011074 [Oryzias melastigma]